MTDDATVPPETSAAALGDPRLGDGEADVGDVTLHYVSCGARDGVGLVFLHGFPEFWYAWRHLLLQFGGAGVHAVAPDMRGYNLSSRPQHVTAYRMRHLTEDVHRLAAALGHARVVLVGHDWGGAVAWATALRFPELVERLVIVNAPHPAIFSHLLASDPAQQRASRYMQEFQSPLTEARMLAHDCAVLASWIIDPGLAKGFLTEDDARRYRAAWHMPGALTAMLNYYRSQAKSPGPPGDREALTVRVPTHVVWGMKDRTLLPANLDGLELYVPDLTIDLVEDANHWVVHQRPDRVAAAITAALAEVT